MLKILRCRARGTACNVPITQLRLNVWSHNKLSFSTVPITDVCPPPTCPCADTPKLDIERKKPLIDTISPHAKHVVVHTGREDWAKRIEDDEEKPNIAKELKALLGPKGPFYDVSMLQALRS